MDFHFCTLCGFVYEQEIVNDEYINDSHECPCYGVFDTEMEGKQKVTTIMKDKKFTLKTAIGE
ncbi:hypothetical protein [Gracilibacillus saliphilus]|uniref:hypothetical protein n=1 Tax=Gracilibacillus saliphilus TaxID=543890 RepID=UPI0013D100C6|nr:hypothetical protein [Gracilibacillus saliphilus]